ncbi:hypothetical protein [Ferroplasma sp.]|uniref:hypothetical protein n=1 Tax=Ferroplasma sp. TaxID=2591003 RepID=UPI00307CC94B
MKPQTTKIIVIIIAAAIIAPSAYFAYEYYLESNISTSSQPFDYIPGNSTMISAVHNNGSEYFVYLDGGSFGVVANTSSTSILDSNFTSSNSAAITSSNNGNPFSGSNVKTSTYDGVTVYELQNVNISGLLVKLANYTGKNLNTTVNIFAYETSGNYVVMGEQNAINESIKDRLSSQDAVQLQGYLNQSYNVSAYYRVNNTIPTISYITIDSTANKSYINIMPASKDDLKVDEILISGLISNPNVNNIIGNGTLSASNGMIHLNIDKGYTSLSALLKTLNKGVSLD